MSEEKKYNCDVIKDLLPLYYDSVCSEPSRAIVEEHLEECADCRSLGERLQNTRIDDALFAEKNKVLQTHAQKEKRIAVRVGTITAGILMIPVIICLICNLAVGHGLDWFFIVLASLLIVASFTVVPLVVPERRLFYAVIAGTASLVYLLLTCCIYSHGNWFFLVTIPTLFGISVVFMPYMVCQIPFSKYPRPFCKLSDCKGIVVMVWDTIWLYATIIICGLNSSDPEYWRIALPVTTLCMLFPWVTFVIIRYLRVHAIIKAGWISVFLGFYTLFADDICRLFIEGRWGLRISHMDFVTWKWTEPMSDAAARAYNANINALVGAVFLAAGIALIVIGARKASK